MLQDLFTPLHSAAFSGELEVAKLLIAHGANTQLQDKVGVVNVNIIIIMTCFGFIYNFCYQ